MELRTSKHILVTDVQASTSATPARIRLSVLRQVYVTGCHSPMAHNNVIPKRTGIGVSNPTGTFLGLVLYF